MGGKWSKGDWRNTRYKHGAMVTRTLFVGWGKQSGARGKERGARGKVSGARGKVSGARAEGIES